MKKAVQKNNSPFQKKWGRLVAILEPGETRREKARLEKLVFHLLELHESSGKINQLIGRMLAMRKGDNDAVGQLLTDLDVEVRGHFSYHMRGLRKPLDRYLDRIWPG